MSKVTDLVILKTDCWYCRWACQKTKSRKPENTWAAACCLVPSVGVKQTDHRLGWCDCSGLRQ